MMMVASSGADFSPALDAFPTLTDSSGRADDAVSSRGEPEFDMQGFLTPGDAAMSRTRMLELTAQIVTGYVSKNTISHMELHDVISRVHAALEDTGAPGDLGETDGGEGSDGVDLEGQNPEENAALAAQAGPPQIARTRRPRAGDGATA